MERRYASSMSYNSVTTLPTTACTTDLSATYTFAFPTGQPTATTWTINAAPAGSQSDALCETMSLNQAGTRTESGTAADANECWR